MQGAVGTLDYSNVAENFHITDAQLNAQVYRLMRRGTSIRIIYGGGASELRFSLRGFTVVTNAIERWLGAR